MAESFEWKSDGKIFKGVGIYHLTFNVASDDLTLGVIRGRSREEIAAVVQPLLDVGEACHAIPSLIDDSPSALPEHPEFKEHRHDQSVFSGLCWKYGIKALPQQEVYPTPCDWTTMSEFPFWTARKKEFAKPSILDRIIRKFTICPDEACMAL